MARSPATSRCSVRLRDHEAGQQAVSHRECDEPSRNLVTDQGPHDASATTTEQEFKASQATLLQQGEAEWDGYQLRVGVAP